MKNLTDSGKVEVYQEKKLDTPVVYEFAYQEFETIAEVKEAGKWPNDGEILDVVNRKILTAAKAKSYQKATEDLKKVYEASDDYKKAQFLKSAMLLPGMTAARAEAMYESAKAGA